jgi:Tfp pilus assembly major pilin PilA
MTSASMDIAQVALLVARQIKGAGASSWSRRWCHESSNHRNGRPVEPRSATGVELKREAAEVMIGRVIHRTHTDFLCEGYLGAWDGLCGHRVLAGEGYVQSGEHRLCLACAEIEAKQVAAGEETLGRALVEGVEEAIAEPVRSAWDFETSACPSSTREESIEKKIEEPHYVSRTMSAAQALLNENEQLAKLACSQETITRILEDERRHRERLAGNRDRPVLLLTDEPIDEEVALLVEGIAEEVAVIGVLCDTLSDRLES